MSKLGETSTITVSCNEICLNVGMTTGSGGKRGKVKGMSRKSKSALMHFMNSVLYDTASFITLTYRYNQRDAETAYKHLRLFHKRMCYKYGSRCVVWKRELQKRGAVHFHLFILDAVKDWTRERIIEEWLDVTGQEGDTAARKYGVDQKDFDVLQNKDAGVIISYLAKYAVKEETSTIGKAWGILGRKSACETGRRHGTNKATIVSAVDTLTRWGAQRYEITPTGVQYRLYLGHVGSDGRAEGDTRASEFVARFAESLVE